ERVYRHMEVDPPDVRGFNPRVPEALWNVLRKMLAKRPEDRFQTPAELLAALEAAKHGRSPVPPPPAPRQAWRPSAREPAPPEQPAERSRKRREAPRAVYEGDSTNPLGLSGDQLRAAAGQFDRAREAREAGNEAYALELLLSCCKLDPANLVYRQTLREVGRSLAGHGRAGRWLGALASLRTR